MSKRVLSAVQPTGGLHLGNYLGSMRRWEGFQQESECLFFVADMHAVTVWMEPKELLENTYYLAAAMIACNVDPQKSILFVQSQVHTHAELAWLFNCVARLGWLNRMTQFKEKAGKDRENVSIGLYAYPTLMAADVLAYKATHVPVGEDQKQHLELTRDIAQKFNHDYDVNFFPLVEPLTMGPAPRVMSLRDGTKKMSKSDISDMSRIHITDTADDIALKIRKAKTDPDPLPDNEKDLEARPEADNLVTIYAALTNQSKEAVCQAFAGQLFSAFKPKLAEIMIEAINPIAATMQRLLGDKAYLQQVLDLGRDRALAISEPILAEAKKIVGFLQPKG